MEILNRETLEKALEKWGAGPQLDIMIEEMAEWTKDICKLKRGIVEKDFLIMEMVDVFITLQQIFVFVDNKELFDSHYKKKIEYLQALIEGE